MKLLFQHLVGSSVDRVVALSREPRRCTDSSWRLRKVEEVRPLPGEVGGWSLGSVGRGEATEVTDSCCCAFLLRFPCEIVLSETPLWT